MERQLIVKVYPAEEINNPDLFKGDRITFFLVEQVLLERLPFTRMTLRTANSESFLWAGQFYPRYPGIQVPSNFPAFTPYGAVRCRCHTWFHRKNKMRNNPM